MATSFWQPVKVSQDDVAHAFLYAQELHFRNETVAMSIVDRIFTLDSTSSMSKNMLLTGIKHVMDAGLASRGAFVLHGMELDIYLGRAMSSTPQAVRFTVHTLVEETKKIAKLDVSVISVHMDILWSYDVRWMMLRYVLTYIMQGAAGQKVHVGKHLPATDVMMLSDDVVFPATGISWQWRKSKLRRFFLYGTSMTDEPYPTVSASLEDFEYFLLSGESVALTWYFSTRAMVLGRSSFYLEYCNGIDNAADIGKSFAPFLEGLPEVHALICQDHNGKQVLVGDFARTEAEINLIATNTKRSLLQRLTWSPAENPAFLQTLFKPLAKVSTISLALSQNFESGLYHDLFRQTCLPILSTLTSAAVSMDYKEKRFYLSLHADTKEMFYLDEILDAILPTVPKEIWKRTHPVLKKRFGPSCPTLPSPLLQ